ncbi:MAG: flagellar biosynthesis protein FlhF, partial [Halioglobus sp.]
EEKAPVQRQPPPNSSSGTYGDPRYQREKRNVSSHNIRDQAKLGSDHVNLSREARLMQRNKEEEFTSERPEQRRSQQEGSNRQNTNDDFNQASERLIKRFGLESKELPAAKTEEILELPDKSLTLGQLREVIREEFYSAQQNVSVGSLLEGREEKVGSVRFLISKGISRDIAVQIEQELNSRFGPVDITVPSPERIGRLNELKNELARRIFAAGPITLQNDRPTVAALVGGTGVGKTTTLVKIAAQYAGELKKKVAVITLDLEKVGALEQMQALLMPHGIALASAESGYQLQRAVASFADCDLILIDTAGRSQYNWQQVDDLVEVLSHIDDLQVYLTMSATTKDLDVYGIIQQFAILDVDSFIFTKLDETIGQGILVNVCQKTKKPIRYLTMGNRVPQDLKIADPADIARKLLVQHNSREFQAIRNMASG